MFTSVRIASIRNETPDLVHIELDASRELIAAYTIPGQYVQIQHGDMKPGFFALASGPHDGRLELLIKRGAPLADVIASKIAGETLSLTAAQGKGYPLSEAFNRDVYLAGVGSGIAPLRALMHEILTRRGEFGKVTFLYGARTCDAFPYAQEVAGWPRHDITVIQSCSRPAEGSWDGATGRIQQALRAQKPKVNAESAVFVCGMKPLVEELKTVFGELGLLPGRVFQNF
jgi:NAD(P)H-flavin reductase